VPRIIGVGLPRTGTTSLAKALEVLGYEVIHFCPLTHVETLVDLELSLSNPNVSLVSSHRELFSMTAAGIVANKFILLHRDLNEWRQSVGNFGKDAEKYANGLFEAYLECWAIDRPNLLHYNVREGWEPLCEFLGKTKPLTGFPKTNQGPQNWSI
jgi:hypothetical protein